MSPSSSSSRLLIVSNFFILSLAALGLTTICKAQAKLELYGGYSYFRASIAEEQFSGPIALAPVSEKANLNGWEFSGQYKFLPFLGAIADFNGTYGTLRSANTREHTFLFGPQISLPAKVSLVDSPNTPGSTQSKSKWTKNAHSVEVPELTSSRGLHGCRPFVVTESEKGSCHATVTRSAGKRAKLRMKGA